MFLTRNKESEVNKKNTARDSGNADLKGTNSKTRMK